VAYAALTIRLSGQIGRAPFFRRDPPPDWIFRTYVLYYNCARSCVRSTRKGGTSMLIHKAYKFRLYPNKEQEILIAKTIGCARFVFNHFLAKWKDAYKNTSKGLTYSTCSAQPTQLKKEFTWLKEVDSIAVQSSLKNLADSYARFFKKQNKTPRFKSKNNRVQSYTTKQ
jgi:hypothetical protein